MICDLFEANHCNFVHFSQIGEIEEMKRQIAEIRTGKCLK